MKIKLALLSVFMAFTLVACEDIETVRKSKIDIEKKLPQNCTIDYLGKFATGGVSIPVLVVQCDGKRVTTVNSEFNQGKSSIDAATIMIDELPFERKL